MYIFKRQLDTPLRSLASGGLFGVDEIPLAQISDSMKSSSNVQLALQLPYALFHLGYSCAGLDSLNGL